ncbi:MAG: hypothetical protein LBM60_03445, partial [Clostridium sp.]|nr:hypothetical protein [Clostridium sp.]
FSCRLVNPCWHRRTNPHRAFYLCLAKPNPYNQKPRKKERRKPLFSVEQFYKTIRLPLPGFV